MNVKCLASIHEIPKEDWNAIVGENSLICSHEYLSAIEKSKINDCRYFYPVVYQDGQLIAHACLYYISTELDLFCDGILKRLINGVRRLWPNFLILRSVECGTPVALGSTISFKDGYRTKEVLMSIVHEAEKVAEECGVKVVLFRDFYDHELELFDEMKKAGYRRIHNLPSVHMQVKWSSFEEYLNALRSPYRYRTRKVRRLFRDNSCSIEIIRDFESIAEELAVLWQNSFDAATEYRREILGANFFRSINEIGDHSAIIAAKQGNQIIGFALILEDDDVLEWLFCGMNYDMNNSVGTYFNLIYEIIRYSIEKSFKLLDMGITTVAAKVDVGGDMVSQVMYMKYTGRLIGGIVPRLFDLMTPSQANVDRHVFKDKHPDE